MRALDLDRSLAESAAVRPQRGHRHEPPVARRADARRCHQRPRPHPHPHCAGATPARRRRVAARRITVGNPGAPAASSWTSPTAATPTANTCSPASRRCSSRSRNPATASATRATRACALLQTEPHAAVADGHSGFDVFLDVVERQRHVRHRGRRREHRHRRRSTTAASPIPPPGMPDTYTVHFTSATDYEVLDSTRQSQVVTTGTYRRRRHDRLQRRAGARSPARRRRTTRSPSRPAARRTCSPRSPDLLTTLDALDRTPSRTGPVLRPKWARR